MLESTVIPTQSIAQATMTKREIPNSTHVMPGERVRLDAASRPSKPRPATNQKITPTSGKISARQ